MMKMQQQTQAIIALLIFTLTLSGCVSQCELTIVSSRKVQLDLNTYGHPVTGEGPTVADAVDAALKKAGNTFDALIDCVVYQREFDYKVVGIPIKTSEARKWD